MSVSAVERRMEMQAFGENDVVFETIQFDLTQDRRLGESMLEIDPVPRLHQHYCDLFERIKSYGSPTVRQLRLLMGIAHEIPPNDDQLLQIHGNLCFLRSLIKIVEKVPTSICVEYRDQPQKELFSTESTEAISWVTASMRYNYNEVHRDFQENLIAPRLRALGWDLSQHRYEIERIQILAERQIIPVLLYNAEDIEFQQEIAVTYPCENFIIDYELTPDRFQVLDRLEKLPQEQTYDERFFCSLSSKVMLNPTVMKCGHVFDKVPLRVRLKAAPFCPDCKAPTELNDLVPLPKLQNEITSWVKGLPFTKVEAIWRKHAPDDFLSIRGSTGELRWDQGLPMKQIGEDRWVIEIHYQPHKTFKFLFNDKDWEWGVDQALLEGSMELSPRF